MFDSYLNIRPVQLKHAKRLQEIAISTFSESFAGHNTPANMDQYLLENFSLRKIEEEIEHPGSRFFFAEKDQGVVGYLKVNTGNAQTEAGHEHGLEIERIYVLKDFQGLSIGKALYEKALEIARSENFEMVWLGVWEKNEKAIGFYKKMGFEEFAEHDFYLGSEKQRDVLMMYSF